MDLMLVRPTRYHYAVLLRSVLFPCATIRHFATISLLLYNDVIVYFGGELTEV